MPRVSKRKRVLQEMGRKLFKALHGYKDFDPCDGAIASSADGPPSPNSSGDYFEAISSEFEATVSETSVVHSLEKRTKMIEEVSLNGGKKKKVTENPPGSRVRTLDTDMLASIFEDNAGPCNMPRCLGKLEMKLEDSHGNTTAVVSCKVCDYQKIYHPKCLAKGKDYTEYNMGLIYESLEDGRGYNGYHKICANLGHEPLSRTTYYEVKDYIGSKIFAMHSSKHALLHQCLVSHYETLGRYPDENGILDIDVSFDGSWLTRGPNSRIGLGVVIEVNMGFIIDFHVFSNHCIACNRYQKQKQNKKITQNQYKILTEAHKDFCNKNYYESESSGAAMEAETARLLWGRSLQHKFRYVNFIGEGDSCAYKTLCSMNNNRGPYDNVKVQKQECVNNVGKRFGSKLRKLREDRFIWLTDKEGMKYRKPLSNGHNLTENVIYRLEFYFEVAVRKCKYKSVKELKDMFMAIIYHCASTDASPKHHLCPKGTDSYCFYNKALAQKRKPERHKDMIIYFKLGGDERRAVLQVFKDMCSDDLLNFCLIGKTQNPNKSLHTKIWKRLSKVKFLGLKTVQQSVCLTVLQHNWGYQESYPLSGIGFGDMTASNLNYLEIRDSER